MPSYLPIRSILSEFWSAPGNLYLCNFSMAISTSKKEAQVTVSQLKALHPLIPLTQPTFNSCQKRLFYLPKILRKFATRFPFLSFTKLQVD